MVNRLIVIFIILSLSGCASLRTLESARSKITKLEQLNEAGTARNGELESLLESERTGNQELKRIISEKQSELDGYFESEKRRIEAERKLIDSLSGIFEEGSDIIEELIRGYRLIREFFEAQENND